jgi:nitrous oxide reductase accessory protein NosL
MHKTILIVALVLFLGGCHTTRDLDDPRPPLMNDDSFTNFVPMVIETNITNSCVEP